MNPIALRWPRRPGTTAAAAATGPALRHLIVPLLLATLLGGGAAALQAQTPAPRFQSIQALTNREVVVSLTGAPVRLEVATPSGPWQSLVTLTSATPAISLVHTDTAAPYLPQRLYRALSVPAGSIPGDLLPTSAGDVLIRPINHGSAVLQWNGKMIYNDPVGGATPYAGLPKADLILVSHSHSDHFSSSTLDAIRNTNAILVVPQAVYNSLTTAQKALAVVLTNGATTTALGIPIEAVPAYNLTTSNHPRGTGNGYVLTIGGQRLFFSGDTEDIPEIRNLRDIDVAFLCMNIPFTMSVEKAISTVREFQPRILYPYHYRNQDGTYADLNEFKRRVGQDLGVEVRFRKWY